MSFPPEGLSRDAFLGGRLRLWQPLQGYRAAIDPVLLAAFVPARPGQRVLELGCGGGTAVLCLARRVPGLELHGVEIQPDYAELARRNAAENGLALRVHVGDVLDLPAGLRLGFDQVLANPPFHAAAAPPARDAGRDATRVLVRARKSSRAPLRLHPPLRLHAGSSHAADGVDYTVEAETILRDMAELLPDARAGGRNDSSPTNA